jgi:hypothetical protein
MKKQILTSILLVCLIGASSFSFNNDIDYKRLFRNVKNGINPVDIESARAVLVEDSQELASLFESGLDDLPPINVPPPELELQGFDWIERAFEKRESWLVRIKVDTIFNSVRSDPRYKEILRKMNLE